jgi:hypothetical protein
MRWRAPSSYLCAAPSVKRMGGLNGGRRHAEGARAGGPRVYYRIVRTPPRHDSLRAGRVRADARARRRWTRLAAVLATAFGAVAGMAGCSSGSSANFPPTVATATVFDSEVPFKDLARFQVFATDFTVPDGTLQVTVDWGAATDDLDIVLSNPACDALSLVAGLCKVLASEKTNVKPERITMATTATSYRLFVINMGPQAESGTVAVKVVKARLTP